MRSRRLRGSGLRRTRHLRNSDEFPIFSHILPLNYNAVTQACDFSLHSHSIRKFNQTGGVSKFSVKNSYKMSSCCPIVCPPEACCLPLPCCKPEPEPCCVPELCCVPKKCCARPCSPMNYCPPPCGPTPCCPVKCCKPPICGAVGPYGPCWFDTPCVMNQGCCE